MSEPRYFRLRYEPGFTDEMVESVSRGYRRWREWVTEFIGEWSTRRKGLPVPNYTFGDVALSVDRTVITIKIEGDPGSYGALKTFEDGVPPDLFYELPSNVKSSLEMSYENGDMGLVDKWLPAFPI